MEIIIGSLVSFSVFHYTSHPKSRFHKKIPIKKFFNIQIVPHINLSLKKRVIHLHHWMLFSPLFAFAQTGDRGILSAGVMKGLLIGGIIQGLMYKDRFHIIFKQQDYITIKDGHYQIKPPLKLKFWK
jgi:hypothetical protein